MNVNKIPTWQQIHKDRVNDYQRNWYENNKGRYKDKRKQWRFKNKERIKKLAAERYIKHKEEYKARYKKRYALNKLKINSINREKYRLNPKIRIEQSKRWRENNRDRYLFLISKNYFRRTYGIDKNKFEEMLELQNGLCFICGQTNGSKRLVVDHHHDSGKIRKLLCLKCNFGIGNFKESPDLMDKAANYIRQHR